MDDRNANWTAGSGPIVPMGRCQFLLQDMFNISWHDYDLIYACSTCYGAAMCKRIATKALKEMGRGLILSVSKPLYNLKVIDRIACVFSWGKDTVYVHLPRAAAAFSGETMSAPRRGDAGLSRTDAVRSHVEKK